MCFWVVLRDFSISLAAFPTPDEISLDLFLISLCRRSRIGRTVPLRFFSVSRWELARLWDGVVSRLLCSGDAVSSCSPLCLLSYFQKVPRYRQGSDRNANPPSMDLECSNMSVNLVSQKCGGGVLTFKTFSYSFACAFWAFSVALMYSSRYPTACFHARRRSSRRAEVYVISVTILQRPGKEQQQLTSLVSVSGTATSLKALAPVLWRVGSCVGTGTFSAECEDMSVGDLCSVFVSVRTGRLMVAQIYNMKLLEI